MDNETATSLSVRPADEADIDAIGRINQTVQRLHAELEPELFKAVTDEVEVSAYFAAQLSAPQHQFRVAEIDGLIAGYVWFEKQETADTPFTFPTRRFYVHHIAVDTAARRRGVASALLRNIEAEARAEGITKLVLATWATNQVAQAFFTSQSFRPFILMLQKNFV
ncbi:GNAT family N-acetyltransferase [Methyloferula stellata]|uniref:GNAT family N-acetyltransferase n=1 Tax=Methyloferula stellata TaxID=876270 RepID=UPI0003662C38|nr:GNAT family N-acetyltransferase [Methyloferula stellata]